LSGGAARAYLAASTQIPFIPEAFTMARLRIRPQSPRGATLLVSTLLWLVGALEMVAEVEIPYDAGQWSLLLGGALLILGCLVRGL
jgi:hypothetical protein